MPTNIEFVPDNFLSKIFQYYGLKSTSFIMLSGIVISGLGFDSIVNPTVWVISSFAAIIIGYAFRRRIGRSLPKSIVFTFFLWASLVATNIGISRDSVPIPIEVTQHVFYPVMSQAVTLFIFAIGLVVPFISYKKEEQLSVEDMPTDTSQKLFEILSSDPIFYEKFFCDAYIEKTEGNQAVRIDTEILMEVRNRSGQDLEFPQVFPRLTEGFRLHSFQVNDTLRDLSSPKYNSEDGVRISTTIPAKSSIRVKVKMTEFFPENGYELYVCYDHAAASYRFSLKNHTPEVVGAWIEPLSINPPDPVTEDSCLIWEARTPLFPFQGVRVVWKLKA